MRQAEMDTVTATQLITIESVSQVVAKNKPVIKEKIEKAITALTLIQVIDTDEQDQIANNTLAKCNATLPVVEGLRKEYTSIIDDWKKSEMALEKSLIAEMDRVRALRNDRANREAKANQERQAEIDRKRVHDIEVARIKKEQVLAVELGIANRIAAGETKIAEMFNAATLEAMDALGKQLDGIKPKLKEDIFHGFLAVDYNPELVPYDEFKAIVDAAFIHFNYAKCDAAYVVAVNAIITKWKGQIPRRKAELERLAKASTEEQARLKQEAADRAQSEGSKRSRELKEQEESALKKANEAQANQALDAEFQAQIATQDIAPMDGVRNIVSYRLKDEATLEAKPIKIVEVLGRVMVNILADPGFKGIFKRDKSGIVKRNAKGEAEYINAIQDWLDLLTKIKPAPEFDGVVKIEDVVTVAKAK